MKYDTLFLSRTLNEDYRWIRRPDYVDASLNAFLRPLFLMIEDQRNITFFMQESKINAFFTVEKEYCALCFLYYTHRKDAVGRQIYALEGICCPKEHRYQMWKNLPYILMDMCGNGYAAYISPDYRDTPQACPLSIEIPNYPQVDIDYRILLKDLKMQGYTDVFLNIIEELNNAKRMYSFSFCTREAEFYLVRTERSYHIHEKRKLYTRQSDTRNIQFQGSDYCEIQLFFGNKMTDYQMSVLAVNNKNKLVVGYENAVTFGKDGISIATLWGVIERMEVQLSKLGYKSNMKWSSYSREKKELTFYKKEMERKAKWNMEFYQIGAFMRDNDGLAENFIEDDHKMLRQFFQYSLRIASNYYSDHQGRESLYILDMNYGVWIVQFIKKDKAYCMEGLLIPSQYKTMGWLNLDEILQEYVFKNIQYSSAFVAAYKRFLNETLDFLQPISCIITSLPDGNFPLMEGLTIYTTTGRQELFRGFLTKKTIVFSASENRKLEKYYLVPPTLFKKIWNFTYDTVKKKGLVRMQSPIIAIEDNACKASELMLEIQMIIKRNQ